MSIIKDFIEVESFEEFDSFTQSQSHGIIWENEIREKVFNLKPVKNDTNKYDINAKDNKFDINENISIKTTGSDNIDCADILRFYNSDFNKKLTMYVIKYEQKTEVKVIKEILEINYCKELQNILFGSITEEELINYVNLIKSIPKGVVSDNIKRTYINKKKELETNYSMYINISPKVDSKNQRRVQCSIPKISKLFELYPQFIVSRTNESKIRNITICSSIKSKKRQRKNK